MATLVSAFGSASSAALTATSAFTVPYTNLLSTAPVDGDYVFVALWLTRNAAATQAQSSNGTYASVACGTVYLTCMENTSVPSNLSATSTTLFHQYNVPANLSGNAVNLAVFGAPYTAGMARGITVTGFNAGGATAVLLCTAMAVQGIYVPTSNPRTTWCNTISAGGVVDTTSGSGLGWTSSGTPSISSFGSTKVGSSNLTSAIVDDVISGAVTGILNLGSGGYQTTDFSTRYSTQQGLFTGELDNLGFASVGGSAFFAATNANSPVPPALSGGPSTWTGKYLAVGQAVSGVGVPRDTYITGFGYDPNFFGAGPYWFVYTNNLVNPSAPFWAGTEEPVLTVMFTNNSTVTAAATSVGNTTSAINNAFTYLDPQGSTMYFTSLLQASGVVGTVTNTAAPTSGKMVVPTMGGNTTLSWTSKPSSTSLAGCTAPPVPLDNGLYQGWIDNNATGSQYWDCTPVVTSSGNASSPASAAPGIETTKTVIATGTTGFQIGSLVMTYGANRSGINPVPLFGHLRHGSASSTNFGFGAAFSFKPSKAAIIGTISEVVETDKTETSGAARTLPRLSEVTKQGVGENGGSARALANTSELPLRSAAEIQNLLAHATTSEVTETPTSETLRQTNLPKVDKINNRPTPETARTFSASRATAIQNGPVSESVRSVATPRTSAANNVFTSQGTTSRLLHGLSAVTKVITTTNTRALSLARSAANQIVAITQSVKGVVLSRASTVAEIPTSTSQKLFLRAVLTQASTFARGGYIPTLNSILGLGVLGQEALGYGNFYPTSNWYDTTLAKTFVKTYIETGAVNLLSTTENGKSLIRNLVSTVADLPTSTSQRAVTIPRSSAVAETPTTTSQRSVAHSLIATVAEILSGENSRSTAKNKVSEVYVTPSGENTKQVAGNVIGSVAEAPKTANTTSKTLTRISSVVETLNTVATKTFAVNRVSEVAEKPYGENTKSLSFARASEGNQRPTTTSQRSANHSFASTASLLLSATSVRTVGVARASAVYQAFYTTAFAIILKLTTGFIATFTEYPKTEGFTEYPKTETMQDATNAVFTTSATSIGFQDDGVASYTEGQ